MAEPMYDASDMEQANLCPKCGGAVEKMDKRVKPCCRAHAAKVLREMAETEKGSANAMRLRYLLRARAAEEEGQ